MVQNEVLSIGDDYVDRIVRVVFDQGQPNDTMLEVLHVLTDTLRRGANANRFEELVALELTSDYCEIRLRYLTNPKRKALGLGKSGYDDTLGNWYIRYVFAAVDSIRKVSEHPFFAPSLSVFLEDAAPFDSDPLPD